MESAAFSTPTGRSVTAEMAEVDDVATDEFSISIRQMMEHAGRALAAQARAIGAEPVVVLAGTGGNGGGGLCAARHLANRDVPVSVVLDSAPETLGGATRAQYEALAAMGVSVDHGSAPLGDRSPGLVVDALVGYGLDGPLRGTAAELVESLDTFDGPVLSLDVPSGLDATTGARPGPAVEPEQVLTLALPKTGLTAVDAALILADIGLPAAVYETVGIGYTSPFTDGYRVSIAPE